jgi:hypothetical protein
VTRGAGPPLEQSLVALHVPRAVWLEPAASDGPPASALRQAIDARAERAVESRCGALAAAIDRRDAIVRARHRAIATLMAADTLDAQLPLFPELVPASALEQTLESPPVPPDREGSDEEGPGAGLRGDARLALVLVFE